MLRSPAMKVDDFYLATADELLPLRDLPARGVFALTRTVRGDETSALVPHLNNITIVSWIDLIAARHGDAAGAARADLAAQGRMWFVARHEINYLAEAFAGEKMLLITWVQDLGRTSLTRATRIVRMGDGVECVRATSRWAMVDLATRKPVPIDEPARTNLM